MKTASRFFLMCGLAALAGGIYFAIQLGTQADGIAGVIVYPIYIGFSAIIGGFFLILGLIFHLIRKKK